MMTRFKAFPGGVGGMMHAVLSFQGLTWEEMGLIRQIAPKKGERKDFKDFGGAPQDLTAAERVLLQMNQVPRLKAKCRVALFIMKWEELRNESVQALDTVQAACQELRRSSRLQSVLSCALTVGNAVNDGSPKGSARAITLESLAAFTSFKVTGSSAPSSSPPAQPARGPLAGAPQASTQARTLLDFLARVVRGLPGAAHQGAGGFLGGQTPSLPAAAPLLSGGLQELEEDAAVGLKKAMAEYAAICGRAWVGGQEGGGWPGAAGTSAARGGEDAFGARLHGFLASTEGARGDLAARRADVEAEVASVAAWFGERQPHRAPQALTLLITFITQFDAAYAMTAA
ncbi:unnamed protein product [Ostreobium quekettii]|uniref:FH2 domain-containing protein n=1 Tax=Ostreobium quekettii TaxID=121088 RepID=A0A8S1IRD4_9CHLO|nr:unnamed protein product [Ostreobium quekettii]